MSEMEAGAMRASFIDGNHLIQMDMKATFLPKRGQVPNLRLVKHVVPHEVAWPLVNNPSSTCSHVNDISSTTLGGIMEEMVAYPIANDPNPT